jgi:hypothetical protein
MTRLRPGSRAAALLLGFGLGLAANACVLPNPNHCQNLDLDPNAWCSYYYGQERPYCSPCAAEANGCVSQEPSEDECPAYSRSETDTGGTESESGDTESESGGTETETGSD